MSAPEIYRRWAATSAGRFLQTHFAAYRQRAKWPFLWRISVESLLVPTGVAFVLAALFELSGRADLQKMSAVKLLITAVIFAPFFETLLFQSLPVAIARTLGWGFWGQVALSNVLFGLAHFRINVATGIVAGLISGFYIAFTYVHWRETSFRAALWMTAGLHAIHNLVLVSVSLLARQFT